MKYLAILLLVAAASAAPSRKPQFRRGLNRIVGGDPVVLGEVPYQISFQDVSFGAFHFCGGSIYNAEWIIDAAHCVAGEDFENPRNLQIVAGTIRAYQGGQVIAVDRIIQHEDYGSLSSDISLLHLAKPLEFDDNTKAIAMPTQGQESKGVSVVSGWGATNEGGSAPSILQKVAVSLVSQSDCKNAYGASEIDDTMICAGEPEGGKDSCQGDSGGPLACFDDGTEKGNTYLCGIVSWGYGCARPDYPGVYTRVAYFVDWIETNTK